MSSVSFVFERKIYFPFLEIEGWGGVGGWDHKIGHFLFFVAIIKYMTPKWFKLQPIQSLDVGVSSARSSHKPHTFWLRREQPL